MPELDDRLFGSEELPAGVGPRRLEGNRLVTPGLQAGVRPEQARLPNLADLKNLSLGELNALLDHYGIQPYWGALQTQAMGYVSRMTEYRPGSEEWREAVANLLDRDSSRGALGMNRRIAQAWSSLDAIDGDVNKTMIWLTENDEDVCDPCEERGGVEMTWAEWQIAGPPGTVCLGGSYCRCDLVVVE